MAGRSSSAAARTRRANTGSQHGRMLRRRGQRAVMVFLAMLIVLIAAAVMTPDDAEGQEAGGNVAISVQASNGSGRAVTPGRPCDDGGTGAYWHHQYSADLPSGTFGTQDAEAAVSLDLHSDLQRFPNVDGPYDPGESLAFLQGAESHASLLTERGSIKLRLSSGTCDDPTLAFDGSTASGSGTWEVVPDIDGDGSPDGGTGAYQGITGSGSFDLMAEVDPGADNDLSLSLEGSLTVPAPALDVEVVNTYWGSLGTDYLSRRVTVVYRVTNSGAGDAFGAQIDAVTSQAGSAPMVTTPIPLGDLAAGESRTLTIRHQLALSLFTPPCFLVLLGCRFSTAMTASMPDALDQSHVFSDTVGARAPLLPPPF